MFCLCPCWPTITLCQKFDHVVFILVWRKRHLRRKQREFACSFKRSTSQKFTKGIYFVWLTFWSCKHFSVFHALFYDLCNFSGVLLVGFPLLGVPSNPFAQCAFLSSHNWPVFLYAQGGFFTRALDILAPAQMCSCLSWEQSSAELVPRAEVQVSPLVTSMC